MDTDIPTVIVAESSATAARALFQNGTESVPAKSPAQRDLLSKLHAQCPYTGFPLQDYPKDLQGWHCDHPAITRLVREIRPKLVIEVGSWKGGSAIHMAGLMKEGGVAGQIVCVDTWLGAMEFWLDHDDPTRYQALKHRFGFPNVYYQFLANVLHCKMEDVIVPFPQTSSIGARWFAHHKIQADLIYIDASHDEPDVAADLRAYWPVVKYGGVMFGDDYDQYWPGLIKAVDAFVKENGLLFEQQDGFWIIHKPAASNPQLREPLGRLSAQWRKNNPPVPELSTTATKALA